MKKIAQILCICIIIATIIVISTIGFKVGLKYSENTQININIGKEFDVKDIKAITNEVFPKQSVMIQQVELYKDMAQITVKSASDDQIDQLNTKINEKYGTENKVSDIVVSQNTNTRLRDIAKPYFIPILIASVIIIAYILIRYRKLGIGAVLYKTILYVIVPQVLLFCVYALTRAPINRVTAIIAIVFYVMSWFTLTTKLSSNLAWNEK